MDSVGSKPNLRETGTRYDHYMELKEVFLLGIDVIDRMNQRYLSDSDLQTKRKLTNAVEMIERRLEYLSDFAEKSSDLERQLWLIWRDRPKQLIGGADVKSQDSSQQSDSSNQVDPPFYGQ